MCVYLVQLVFLPLFMYFPIGLSVFGVFGAFTYYLPELYPTRLRGTGAGFCYNAGRLIAAPGDVSRRRDRVRAARARWVGRWKCCSMSALCLLSGCS